ncbi:MAG: TetR/AcrR family transcriptional regulator [Spirochaetaceae bacterium]|jgi:AcrR family transcriptional regulator|nr:TetR/AcrR family transcriptional regulator [Spirochaetaceae bacterium]
MTKIEIIQAAFKVWGEDRYETTSLSTLSSALNVTKAALYHHFKNKDALLDAMYDTFFDSMSNCLRPYFEETLACAEHGAGHHEIVKAFLRINMEITSFFVSNPCYFIFALVNVHGNMSLVPSVFARMRERGIDFEKLKKIEESINVKNTYPSLFHMIFSTSMCMMANSLRMMRVKEQPAPGAREITERASAFIRRGLGFSREKVYALNWEELEKAAAWRESIGGGGGRHKRIIKAIASVVAAVGPWAASMAMIAEKSGLSKSGLYAHFASKHDMLCQLFMGEFEDVIRHAQAVSRKSDVPEEQLYLAIRAIEGFLTSEPEFLAAISALKMRRIDFEKMARLKGARGYQGRILQIFSCVKNASGEALIDETMATVILFILTDMLIRKPASLDYKSIPNESFRIFYRFIALGIECE